MVDQLMSSYEEVISPYLLKGGGSEQLLFVGVKPAEHRCKLIIARPVC